ncbi:MAG: Gfo/Idh/MocA family oxidoreductase [Chitinophagaceae bacterium]|nr:Gfo/Idh/MocA family oxidoreductase [Chitinophagaceae bacterium]
MITNRRIRIGVMGGASIAERMVVPAIKMLPEHFELIAIASRSSDKAEAFASAFETTAITGYGNLIDRADIDAIYMPLPTGLHEEWVGKCLTGGKHVLVEKSFAPNFEVAKRLIEQAKSSGLVLMENFMFRHHIQHQFTWNALKEGSLGDLRLFRSQFGFPPLDKSNFRYNIEAGGGSLLDAGAYTIKAAQWFLGSSLNLTSATLYIDPVSGVDIHGNASFVNNNGLVAQLSFGFDNYYQCNYEFWGSKGTLFANRAFTPKPIEEPTMLFQKGNKSETIKLEADNHFRNLLAAFHEKILQDDNKACLDELLDQSRLITAVQEQATKILL